MDPTRRQLLAGMVSLAGTAALVSSCTGGSASPSPGGASSSSASTSASATSSATASATTVPSASAPALPALPRTTAWQARAGEVEPAVKAVAVGMLQAAGAWGGAGSHGPGLAGARARLAAAGFDPALASRLGPLVTGDPAGAIQVVDAQYGGILSSTSSVLVVVDQWLRHANGTLTATGTTLDVRLVAGSPRWRVVEVHPASQGPRLPSSSLSATARSLLANTRVRLPYAARADVGAGGVADSVLSTLAALSREHVVDVSVIRSGHPLYVFGTSRPSDHPKGHAVDVWALDGKPLVVPANLALAERGMRLAVAQGAYNVGGPVLLSGSEYFSDSTHHDHIHLGFRG
jgi:hypothetical protein